MTIYALWDSERTERDKRGVGRVGRLLSAQVCPTGSCAFSLFFLILIIPASLLRVALPRLLIMRYRPLSPRPRARATESWINPQTRTEISTPAAWNSPQLDVALIIHRLSIRGLLSAVAVQIWNGSHVTRECVFARKGVYHRGEIDRADTRDLAYKQIISILRWLTAFRPWVTGQRTHWRMTNGRSVCAMAGKRGGRILHSAKMREPNERFRCHPQTVLQ